MTFTYEPPKIPNKDNITIEHIDAHFANCEVLAERIRKHYKKARKAWIEQGKPDIEATGYIQQAACEAGAPSFKGLHRCSEALTAELHVLHTLLGIYMDEGVNEGNKCWP